MIQFKQETGGDLDAASRREWLETNGLGGFASSTIIGRMATHRSASADVLPRRGVWARFCERMWKM